ncbi:unnamed protein product [Trichobilharzia szidati]|nr:unnamed protein product [Trichobilharzia szidati]
MKNPNQMTNPSRRSSLNIFPPGYYASSNSTSTPVATFTPTTSSTTIIGNGTLTGKNLEPPAVPVTSANTDKVLSSLSEPTAAITATTTQTGTTTTASSDQPVSISGSNNSTASSATNNMTNISTLSTVTTSVNVHQSTTTVNECTVTTPATNKLPKYISNLPPMGSLKSAKLFVSQAHSLMFHYEPCLEAICQPDLTGFSNALLPDLIITLARNYKFITTGVDAICKHNAAVCLRFVYGSPGTDSLKRTSQQHASQLQLQKQSQQMVNIYNQPDFDYQQHNKTVQSSFTNEKSASSGFGADSSFVHNQNGKMTVKHFQQPGLEKQSLGFRDPDGRQNEKLTSKIKLDYRGHSSGNVKTRHLLSKQLIDVPPVTQRFLSYSGTEDGVGGDNIPLAVFSAISSSINSCNEICLPNPNNELILRTSQPIPVNVNYNCLHKSLAAAAYDNDDQHTSSIPSSGPPPIIQPSQDITVPSFSLRHL